MLLKNREDRIRTCDPLVPNQVLYQAELLPGIRIRLKIKKHSLKNKIQRLLVEVNNQAMHPKGVEPLTF